MPRFPGFSLVFPWFFPGFSLLLEPFFGLFSAVSASWHPPRDCQNPGFSQKLAVSRFSPETRPEGGPKKSPYRPLFSARTVITLAMVRASPPCFSFFFGFFVSLPSPFFRKRPLRCTPKMGSIWAVLGSFGGFGPFVGSRPYPAVPSPARGGQTGLPGHPPRDCPDLPRFARFCPILDPFPDPSRTPESPKTGTPGHPGDPKKPLPGAFPATWQT